MCGGTHGCRPTLYYFVGQGPCALPWVRWGIGGRTEASAPTECYRKCGGAGRCRHRPLRRVWGWCMGVTDCHSQCAHWLRNDRVFARGAVCGGTHGCRPTLHYFVEQGPCALPWVRWGIGGGVRAPRPTEAYLVVRRGGALLPTVVPTDSRALSCPPIGALPRNRLASSATGGASPISPPAGDRKGRPYGSVSRGAGNGIYCSFCFNS